VVALFRSFDRSFDACGLCGYRAVP
jgi:hypothetical protein